MEGRGIVYAVICSVMVVIFIAIFIAALNSIIIEPVARVLADCTLKDQGNVMLNGTVLSASAYEALYTDPPQEVTGAHSSGSNLVRTDRTQCSAFPTQASNANTFVAATPGTAAVPGMLLGQPGYALAVTVLRIVSAIAGLGVIVLIWRAAMKDS